MPFSLKRGKKELINWLQLLIVLSAQTRQEVISGLFHFFRTSQNLTNPEDELYGFCEGKSCNFSILQNEYLGKDSNKDLVLSLRLISLKSVRILIIGIYI